MRAYFRGAVYPIRGLRWLPRARVRIFVMVPLATNMMLFGFALTWSSSRFSTFADRLLAELQGWLPDWLDWLASLLYWLAWPLFVILALIVVYYTFTIIANIVAAPFNGFLAGRVERLVVPQREFPPDRPLAKEVMVAFRTEFQKLGYYLLRALPLLVLSFVPVVNLLAPLFWAAFGAWMLAIQYADYPMANHLIPFADQRRLLAEKRLLALGFGSVVLVMTLVPVLNFFVMPAAVIGATLMWAEEFTPPIAVTVT